MPPGDTCTWTGAVSDDWNTAGNWSCGHVPGPNDASIIPYSGKQPRINTSVTTGSLTLNSGGQLGFDTGGALTLFYDLLLNPQSTLKPSSGTMITLNGGNWTNNGGGVDAGSNAWTAAFNTTTDQYINGTSSYASFYNLTVNNVSMSNPGVHVGGHVGSVDFRGTLTIGPDATFDAGTAHDLIFSGNLINNGGTLQLPSAEVDFTGGQDQLIGGTATTHTFNHLFVSKSGGTLTFGGGANQVTVNGTLGVYGGLGTGSLTQLNTGSLTLGDNGTLSLGPGLTLNTPGNVTLGSGTTLNPNTAIVNFGGTTWTNNGATIGPGEWTANFNMPGNQTINGSATTQTFYNVGINNQSMTSPTLQIGGSTTTLNVGGTLTLGQDTTFNPGTATNLNVGGNWINNGGSFHGGIGNDVLFGGPDPQIIGGTAATQTFPGDLVIDKSADGVTLGGNTSQLIVNGQLQVGGGFLDLRSATLTTHGPTTIYKTGTLNLGAGTWNSNACIYLGMGGMFNPGTGTVNFRGATWGNDGGTVVPGPWTANFYLSGPQIIGGAATTQQFNNINIINNTMGSAALNVGVPALNLTGNLNIGDSAVFNPVVAQIYLNGNWINNGMFLPGQSLLVFMPARPGAQLADVSAAQTIGGASVTTFYSLTVDNPAGVVLENAARVDGQLNLRTGDLATGAYTLTLGSTATVTGTHDAVGNVQRDQTFTVGVPYSFGQSNTTITFADVGTLTGIAVNVAKTAPAGLTPAVARTYTITPTGAGYNATLRLAYQDAELNGIPEADLRLWRYTGERWEIQGPQTVNPAESWVERSGVTAFSAWALAPVGADRQWCYLPIVLR